MASVDTKNSEESWQKRHWQEIEPTDQSDKVKHSISSSQRIHNWFVLGASVRGKRHAHFGEWRDDSYAVSMSGSWTVLAVADGAGSAPLARIGSRIATDVIVTNLAEALKCLGVQLDFSKEIPRCSQEEEVKQFMKDAFIEAGKALHTEAEQRKCPAGNLATTLLALAHTRCKGQDLIFWINVGDCVLAVFPNNNGCQVLCDDDHGTVEGETCFITSHGIMATLESRARCAVFPAPVRALVLMTDGVADDLYPLKDRLPDLLDGDPVGKGYMVLAKNQPLKGIRRYFSQETSDEIALLSWLNYDKYGSSYDDRTLVLALDTRD